MARCGSCNRLILFGGMRLGDYLFCNSRCLLHGRLIHGGGDRDDQSGLREVILELHDDVSALAAEVEHQKASLAEGLERLDFVERALLQLRNDVTLRPTSRE